MTTRGKVAFAAFLIALFAAVGIGTYATLDMVFPRGVTAVEVEICRPEHSVMPEDLGRTDIPPPPMVCE